MSNDPFSDFSKIFTNEFGRAMTTAWQETLSKSFASNVGQMFGNNTSSATANPFEYFQQFVQQFPGFDRVNLGAGNDYLNFGSFIKQFVDMYSTGADPNTVAAQMNAAFKDGMAPFLKPDANPWMQMFQQLSHLDGVGSFFDVANKIFANQAESFGGLNQGGLGGIGRQFDFSEFTHGKTPAALGPAREWQIAIEEVLKAADRLRSAQETMHKRTLATFEGANERFWRDMGKGDDELTTLKEIYDYWVNCAEDEYYENVMTDEYARDFGEAINSQADFKVKFTALIDRFLEMLNIPNRRELNGIIGQLSRVELRLEGLERFSKPGEPPETEDIGSLRAELASLRAQVSALEGEQPAEGRDEAELKVTGKRKTKKPKDSEKSPNKNRKKARAGSRAKSSAKPEFEITNITSTK
ncbi:MAG: poly(R)-hydroxyalkanoic acid synthase subunit PhaE [Gammaproteobacteria bacterium]